MTTPADQEATEYLSDVSAVLDAERPFTARYYGACRLDVLRLLVARFAPGAVQAMEINGSITFQGRVEFAHHGVMWWEEGGQPAELDLRDTVFGPPNILQKIIDFHGRGSPRIYVLANEAANVDLPDIYTWGRRGNCMVGINKDPRPEFWQQVESLRHRRVEITRDQLRSHGYSVPQDPPDNLDATR